ncbi:hypothetical protein MAM1_0094d05003 [Mucor ambiguus]|uniref:Pacifastin domain-containing protein n=1 Tax=Mucor ambiguus TaxID=91626 RepID=A0A0C9MQG0_9FUNG|nr:hypothetical protein MAM1_0094d05003 [Mucor ambiguus]
MLGVLVANNSCTPGKSFTADDGCNTCRCPESGLKSQAACTLMACSPKVNKATCTAGETFIADDGCNRCHCPPNGLKANAGCTRMFCPPH